MWEGKNSSALLGKLMSCKEVGWMTSFWEACVLIDHRVLVSEGGQGHGRPWICSQIVWLKSSFQLLMV